MGALLKEYISVPDLAIEFSVSPRIVNRWITSTVPGLAVTKVGRRSFIARHDLAEWLATRRTQYNVPYHSSLTARPKTSKDF